MGRNIAITDPQAKAESENRPIKEVLTEAI